jgi:chloramphenicol O-acetyltransferase type B
MSPLFLFAKLFKKLHGRAIKFSNIHASSKVEAGSEITGTNMGKHSFCGYHCEIINCDIGSFCSIANHVIIGGGMHPMSWISTSPAFYKGKDSIRVKFSEHARDEPRRVVIGHDVWIGERAIIKQGVHIGVGAVVGMGSVVTKDVEPYSIVAGCPAREIRKRFDPETIGRLVRSQWWELEEEKLTRLAIHAKDPLKFLLEVES